MGPYRGAYECEKRIDGLAVYGPEIDGIVEKAEGYRGPCDMKHHGIPYMRNGYAVSHARGAQGLSRQQDLIEVITVHLSGRFRMSTTDLSAEAWSFPPTR